MKKLPSIYKNDINKKIKNNREVTYVKEERKTQNINEILNTIFNGTGYSYNIPLIIKTNTNTYQTSLVSKNTTNVITLDNDIIPIKDIISIERKKF